MFAEVFAIISNFIVRKHERFRIRTYIKDLINSYQIKEQLPKLIDMHNIESSNALEPIPKLSFYR